MSREGRVGRRLYQGAAGFAVKAGMLKGLSRGAAPRAEGGSVPVEPGRMGREVALAQPHLMEVAGKAFGRPIKGWGVSEGRYV